MKSKEQTTFKQRNCDSLSDINGLPIDGLPSMNHEISPPLSAGLSMPGAPPNAWISPQANTAVRIEEFAFCTHRQWRVAHER